MVSSDYHLGSRTIDEVVRVGVKTIFDYKGYKGLKVIYMCANIKAEAEALVSRNSTGIMLPGLQYNGGEGLDFNARSNFAKLKWHHGHNNMAKEEILVSQQQVDSGGINSEKIQWCWRERSCYAVTHSPNMISGDPAKCWIKYDADFNARLEAAFQDEAMPTVHYCGYSVDVRNKTQIKEVLTGNGRPVHY